MALSVIIPVRGGGEAFGRCLKSIASARVDADEVIVVADGATDAAARLVEQSGLRLVRTPTPGGPAAARNLGARHARGGILLFVDSDVTVRPTTFEQVLRAFRDHPEISALIGSYDDAPAEPNFLSQYKNLLQHYVHQGAHPEGFTFWGACGAIRRAAFFDVGGFDARYRLPSIEDIELGYRLRQAGHRIRVCKDLQVKHLKRWSTGSLLRSDFFRRALPWTDLILRSGRFDDDLNIDRASRAKVALVYSLLGAAALAVWWPGSFFLAGLFGLLLLALDAGLLRFFLRQRGPSFALRALGWHWFYYLYSGLAFGVGLTTHFIRRRCGCRDGRIVVRPPPADGATGPGGTAGPGVAVDERGSNPE